MKKQYLFIILLVTLTLQGFSQSKVLLPHQVYDQMKANNQLKPGVEYILVNDSKIDDKKTEQSISEKTETPDPRQLTHHKTPSGCSCIVPLDGTFSVAEFSGYTPPDYRNDDASTGAKALPFNFCLYGTNYNSLYINNNGNVSFGSPYSTFTASGFPDPTYIMVAPFWGDVDTRNLSSGLVYYKITPTYMIVKWENVGYYSSYADKLNTFQLIITNGSDPILPNGNNIAFCYGDMQWTTGNASGGVNGFGGTAATVGVNKGDGVNYIQIGRFDQPGVTYDGGYGNNDGVSWLDYQSFYFNSCGSTNIAPIANGLNNCDTLKICGSGDTLILNGLFLAPEATQTTTVTVNTNGTPNATVLNITNGNSATAQVQIIATAANAGNNVITFTATDDGSPVATTVVNVNVYVDTTGLSNFNPNISGNLTFCQGSSTVLSVAPTTYDSYTWNTGSNNTSITVDSSGQYWVTSEKNGCYKTNVVQVHELPLPTPVISGYPFTCSGGTTLLTVDSLIYTAYVWNTTSTNDSVTVGGGTYSVTVTDSNGCVGTSPQVTVVPAIPPVISGIAPLCNGDSALLSTTYTYSSYVWSTFGTTDTVSTQDTASVVLGSYFVTVVDVNGCTLVSAPFSVSSFSYTLNANGVTPFCANQQDTLYAVANPSAGAVYSWSSGSSNDSIMVSNGGSYTLTVTYPNGCVVDTTLIVPNPNPLPTPQITGSLFTCNASTTTLGVTPAYPSYLWSNLASTSTVAVNNGTYTVMVTDQNGCVGTSPSVVVTNSNPTVNITGNPNFCPGDSSTLVAVPSIPAGVSYLWSTSATTQSILVNSSGNYSVVINYSNGCSANDSLLVTVFSSPVANFTQSTSTTNPGVPVNFTDLSTVSNGSIVAWNWNFGDSLGSNSFVQNPTHIYSADGNYPITLAVQSSNGCWDTIRFYHEVMSEIELPNVITPNNGGSTGLNIYFYIKNLNYYPGSSLAIYNRWGNKIYESSDYQNNWKGDAHPDGVYYYILDNSRFKEPKYGFFQILR